MSQFTRVNVSRHTQVWSRYHVGESGPRRVRLGAVCIFLEVSDPTLQMQKCCEVIDLAWQRWLELATRNTRFPISMSWICRPTAGTVLAAGGEAFVNRQHERLA